MTKSYCSDLGKMAEAQSLENELGLRSDSDTEDAKRYEFTSDLKTSKSFGKRFGIPHAVPSCVRTEF